MEEKELQFPMNFDCPNCGSKRRIIEIIGNEEKAKGRIGQDVSTCLMPLRNAVIDPRKPPLFTFPVIAVRLDVCADCGTVYASFINREQGSMVPGKPPKGILPGLMQTG